jgi:hypothetical protein
MNMKLFVLPLLFAGAYGVLTAQQPPVAPVAQGLRVIIIDGDEAANVVFNRMAAEPIIEVRDREDRRVPGAVVRFLVRRVRDRIPALFRNGEAEVRTLTDAAGRARASAVTPLELGNFEIEIEVSHQGQTATATIRQTNYATAADARADGRQPTQGSSANAASQSVAAGAGGLSKLAVIGMVAGGAAGAGGGYYYYEQSQKKSAPTGRVATVTASVASGLQAATAFVFAADAVDFDAASLTYRWEFGDGATATEPAPTHVYQTAGTYTVVVTVSDARQSARSETSVTVHSVTGTWTSTPPRAITLDLTQSGGTIGGLASVPVLSGFVYTQCAVTGVVRNGAPAIVLSQPPCSNPPNPNILESLEFRLDLSADGQRLTGVSIGGSTGNVVPQNMSR